MTEREVKRAPYCEQHSPTKYPNLCTQYYQHFSLLNSNTMSCVTSKFNLTNFSTLPSIVRRTALRLYLTKQQKLSTKQTGLPQNIYIFKVNKYQNELGCWHGCKYCYISIKMACNLSTEICTWLHSLLINPSQKYLS